MSTARFEDLCRDVALFAPLTRVVPSDLLPLPEPLQSALQLAYRQGHISVDELAVTLEINAEEAKLMGQILLERGYLQATSPEGGDVFHARFSGRITRPGGSPLDKL